MYQNESVSKPNLIKIFSEATNDTYIPLTETSFAIEDHFFGFIPFIYHLDNIILHIINVGLVYLLIRTLGFSETVALVSSLIFAFHPMRVESVAWVTERKDVLYAFFYLLSCICWLTYLKNRTWKDFYWIALGCAALSLLAKPMAISIPLIIIALGAFQGQKKPSFEACLELLPFFLVSFFIGLQTYHLLMRAPMNFIWWHSGLTWVYCSVFYLAKYLFPVYLVPFYEMPQPASILTPVYWCAIVAFILIIILLMLTKRSKVLIFAFAWYFLSIFFLFRFDGADMNFTADRFMYLPCLGFCVLFGVAVEKLMKLCHREIVIAFTATVLLCLATASHVQTYKWTDSITFWEYALANNDRFATFYVAQGDAYKEARRMNNAITSYKKAVEVYKIKKMPKRASKLSHKVAELSYIEMIKEARSKPSG